MNNSSIYTNGYFFNKKNFIVQEYLEGLKHILNPEIISINVEEKFVFLTASKFQNNVKLICGGGSGHEPAHSGFVSEGFLSAAVCGEIFSSPSYSQIISAVNSVYNESGVLFVVKNYTGDVLNFTLAQEIFRDQGKKVEILIVDDDIAVDNLTIGNRGLAGTVLIYKILGSMSLSGKSLSEIFELGNIIKKHIFTIGCSIKCCNMPFSENVKKIEEGFIEFGLGIHGEKGDILINYESTNKVVEKLFNYFSNKKCINKGDKIVVLINNLGSLTDLEIYVILNSLFTYALSEPNSLIMERIIIGKLMSSLDMKGFSITIMNISSLEKSLSKSKVEEIITYLDYPVDNHNWVVYKHHLTPNSKIIQANLSPNPSKYNNTSSKTYTILSNLMKELIDKEKYLNEIDSLVGDGDLGSGVSRACHEILDRIQYLDLLNNFKQSFKSIGDTIGRSFGGTSGPLYSIFFIKGSNFLEDLEINNKIDNYLRAFIEGVSYIQKIGRGNIGERTMLDVLIPLSVYFESILKEKEKSFDFDYLIKLLDEKIKHVKTLKAIRGRSSYLQGKEIGYCEPGCELVKIWMLFLIKETKFKNN